MPDLSLRLLEAISVDGNMESDRLLGVTVRGKTDGGGAQTIAMMSGILFSRISGVPYLHTPINTVEHGTDPASWEAYFGFGKANPTVPQGARVLGISDYLDLRTPGPAVIAAPSFHDAANRIPDAYRSLIKYFRQCRGERPNTGQCCASLQPSIAIHIRRGDIFPSDHGRYTRNRYIENTIQSLRRHFPNSPISAYSEGSSEEFRWIPGDVAVHLNTDIFDVMDALISSDILVMAKSALSYVAGLLSRGIVIYEPFYHRPLSGWLSATPDGEIDSDELLRYTSYRRRGTAI